MNSEGVWYLVVTGLLCGWSWLLWPRAWRNERHILVLLRCSALAGLMLVVGLKLLSAQHLGAVAYVLFMFYGGPRLLLIAASDAGRLAPASYPAPKAPR